MNIIKFLASEKLRYMENEQKLKDETNRIRDQQISELLGALLSNKSDFDPKQIKSIISKQPLSRDLQDKVDGRLNQFEMSQSHKHSPPKKLRFEHKEQEDEEESAEFINTKKGAQSKAQSMFSKANLQRGRVLTPRAIETDLNEKLRDNLRHVESASSVPYSDDFDAEESAMISKSKSALVKTKSDIDEIEEDIEERADTVKDTITEKIGDDYSMTFEEVSSFKNTNLEVSEHLVQSKKLKKNESKNRLNSVYSGSRINEEDSIQEEIEESLPVKTRGHEHEDSSSSHKLGKPEKRKSLTKPEIGGKKKTPKFPQNKLLEKLQDSSMNDFITTLSKGVEAQYKEELNTLVKEYSDSKITDYEYSQKKKILEVWKEKELKDIQKKKLLIEGWVQMSEIVSKMKTDEESVNLSSGSIHDLRKVPKQLFSKPDYSKVGKGKL